MKVVIYNGKKDVDLYCVGYFWFELDVGLWLLVIGFEFEFGLFIRLLKGIFVLGGEWISGFGVFNFIELEVFVVFMLIVDVVSLMMFMIFLFMDDEFEVVFVGVMYCFVKCSGFVVLSIYVDMFLCKCDIYKFVVGLVFLCFF